MEGGPLARLCRVAARRPALHHRRQRRHGALDARGGRHRDRLGPRGACVPRHGAGLAPSVPGRRDRRPRAQGASLMNARLLAGPDLATGAEPLADHLRRLGPLPGATERRALPEVLERAGLLGRGGAAFPVGRKWAAVGSRSTGADAVVLANGAEGEPLSQKDRVLMTTRPHLVLDGAELAADAVGAERIML